MYLQFERRSNLNRLSPLQIFIHNFQSLQLPYFTLIYELFCDNISVSQNNLCLLWYCHYKFIFNVILYYFFLFTCHISSSYLVLSCCICGGSSNCHHPHFSTETSIHLYHQSLILITMSLYRLNTEDNSYDDVG